MDRSRHATWTRIVLLAGFHGLGSAGAPAQEAASNPASLATPVTVTDPPGGTIVSRPPFRGEAIDGGATLFGRAVLDDEVPRAGSDEVVPGDGGDAGDERIAEPSEDPFFLGFAAGRRAPPEGEVVDALLLDAIAKVGAGGRPASEVYAFCMFSRRITGERLAVLAANGARPLGFHPQYCVKVALDVAQLNVVAGLPFVRWLGVAEPWQKVHPNLAHRLVTTSRDAEVPLFISVFESDQDADSTWVPLGTASRHDPGQEDVVVVEEDPKVKRWRSRGWQEAQLEELGFTIVEYVDEIAAFRVTGRADRVVPAAGHDFILFIEEEVRASLGHEESMPMIGADYARAFYDGKVNGAALAGTVDSGMHISHEALTSHYSYGWDLTSFGGPWQDLCEHGSHVIGTILGDPPAANERFTGAAPRLGFAANRRFRNAKIFFGSTCSGAGVSLSGAFQTMRGSVNDGLGNVSPAPHVINHSWGSSGPGSPSPYVGTEANARLIDAEIWSEDQLHVFIAHNYGPNGGTISEHGSAKNTLTVGNVQDLHEPTSGGDPGNLWTKSGRGPCGDNRWKPNVVAPGRWVRSVKANSSSSYSNKWGTSMAAPHVVGVIAQLVDHYSWLRYAPARISSLLMGTATTKDDMVYTTENDVFLDHYGAGRVDAYRAHFPDSETLLVNWGFTQGSGNWHSGDFTVEPGATRVVVVMHYVEPAASAGASKALVNDIDMYVDAPPIASGGNTGEYVAQQSAVDNTEIRIINAPPVGIWRWKTWPKSTVTAVKMSVTVQVIYGDTTPPATLSLTVDDSYVKPGESVDVSATVSVPDFVASAVYIDTLSHVGASLDEATTTLKDGIVTDLTDNLGPEPGFDLQLGNVIHGLPRTAKWTVHWNSEGVKAWQVQARSDNTNDPFSTVNVTVDGTAPSLPANLGSSSHAINVWSNDPNVTHTWTAATDNLSGVDGYGLFTSGSAASPGATKDIGAVTSYTETLAPTTSGWWFNMRTVDRSNNWTAGFASRGPYLIDSGLPSQPSTLTSSTHSPGIWSSSPTLTIQWAAATDAHSGLAGYSHAVTAGSPATPGLTPTLGFATTFSDTLPGVPTGYYFSVRALDKAGNGSAPANIGPILIDTQPPIGPTQITSSSHTIGKWSSNQVVIVTWVKATDAHSGVSHYEVLFDHSPSSSAAGGAITANQVVAQALAPSSQGWYAHVRAIDGVGHAAATGHFGPILIDAGGPAIQSVVIDAGALHTGDPNVTVAVQATDSHSGVMEMRLKNDGGTFSSWMPYSPAIAWNLSANGGSTAGGTRTVDVEVRDGLNQVASGKDTIYWYVPIGYFGNACAGSLGLPSFHVDGIPGLNQTMSVTVTNTAATSGALWLGLSRTDWNGVPLPASLAGAGGPGCFLNVSLDVPVYTGPLFALGGVIPNDPLLVGFPFHLQWFLFGDPSGKQVVSTRGATVSISGP